jgi:hypothetical protein
METAMRTLSFILAFGFAFAAPGVNATAESSLPGAGTFTYSGAQLETTTTVAHLTLTPRGRQLPTNAQGSASNVARG